MSTNYKVVVQTGHPDGAGTDANVYIQLFGEKGTSSEIFLDNSDNNFENGKLDTFYVTAEDVGWIDKIRVFHDNSGSGPGWFVDYITVTNQSVGLTWRVDLNRWLAKDEADHSIDVTVDVPIGNVALDQGVIKEVYEGIVAYPFTNSGQNDTNDVQDISYSFKSGVQIDVSTSHTVSTNVQLGVNFFVANASFSATMTSTISSMLGTTTVETLTSTVHINYPVAAGKSITVAVVYYQTYLDGTAATENGVAVNYENKFVKSAWVCVFDGILNADQIADQIRQLLMAAYGVQIPYPLPQQGRLILLLQKKLAITDISHIKLVQKSIPAQLIQPAILQKLHFNNLHIIPPHPIIKEINKPIKKPVKKPRK